MKKHGWDTLPAKGRLIEKGYSSLTSSIQSYHGGFHKFREELGQSQMRTPNGQWRGFDFTVQQALKAMQEHGWDNLPPCNVLEDSNLNGLALAISRYHGGFPRFRELLRQHLSLPTEQDQLTNLLEAYLDE